MFNQIIFIFKSYESIIDQCYQSVKRQQQFQYFLRQRVSFLRLKNHQDRMESGILSIQKKNKSSQKDFDDLGTTNDGFIIEVHSQKKKEPPKQIRIDLTNKVSGLSAFSVHHQNQITPQVDVQQYKYNPQAIQEIQKKNKVANMFIVNPHRDKVQPSNNGKFKMNILPKNNKPSADQFIYVVNKSNYQQLKQKLKQKNQMYTDQQFLELNKTLPKSKNTNLIDRGWRRLSQLVSSNSKQIVVYYDIEAKDIRQGAAEDCYFLSALASVAHQSATFIQKIINSPTLSSNGIYMARFFIQGILNQVIVDDFVPVVEKKQQDGSIKIMPRFAKISKQNQIWGPILEKCWAKLCGGYSKIYNGPPHQVLYALTGCPFTIQSIQRLNGKEDEQKRMFMKRMSEFKKKKVAICASSYPQVQLGSNEKLYQKGLQQNHAYSVLQIHYQPYPLIKLRNPWGHNYFAKLKIKEYQYDWKKNLAQQTLSKIQKANINVEDKKQGEFYMPYDEFIRYFRELSIGYLQTGHNILSLRSDFKKNQGKFFYFDLKVKSQIIVALSQKIKRMEKEQEDLEVQQKQKNNKKQKQQRKRKLVGYQLTTMILAKQVKIKRSQLKDQQFLVEDDNISINDELPRHRSENSNSFEDQQIIVYRYVCSRSNPVQAHMNFVIPKTQLQPGRYVIYVVCDIQIMDQQNKLPSKQMTVTVHSNDTSFPNRIQDHSQLFQVEGKAASNSKLSVSSKNNSQDTKKYELRFLEQVFINKAKQDQRILKSFLQKELTLRSQTSISQNELQSIDSSKIDYGKQSWYSLVVPHKFYYPKMGGYGFFICSLSQSNNQQYAEFIFDQRQYLSRQTRFINADRYREGEKIRMVIRRGQTKILLMKYFNLDAAGLQVIEFTRKYTNDIIKQKPNQPPPAPLYSVYEVKSSTSIKQIKSQQLIKNSSIKSNKEQPFTATSMTNFSKKDLGVE